MIAFLNRPKVTVGLDNKSHVTETQKVPLVAVTVSSQRQALTVEEVSFEWLWPEPKPRQWSWEPPTANDLGITEEAAVSPQFMDVVAPAPPKQPFHLQDGQTKTFTFVIRVLSEWGQPNDWEANLRAHVRLNNRSRPYATGAVPILIRPDVLAEAVKKEEEERSQRHQKQPNGEPPSNK